MKYDIKKAAKEFGEYYASFDPCAEKHMRELEEIYKVRDEISSYELKARNIEYLCKNSPIHIFKNCPLFFEFSSGRGRFEWGGLSSQTGLFLFEKTADLWLEKYRDEASVDLDAGRMYCWNNPVSIDHFTIGYDLILEKGLLRIVADAMDKLEECKDEKGRGFLNAVVKSVNALILLAERFSEKALSTAKELPKDSKERAHFEAVAKAAARVPQNPPESFFEALCAIVFCREAIGSLEGIGISIFGHLDRILEKYYIADLESGKITYDEMKNLLHLLFTYTDVRFDTKNSFHETSTSIVIGGCKTDGSVCCNDITYAVLDAVYEGRYINTKVNCRVSSAHPDEYLKRFAKVQAANIPTIVMQNDDVLIPARVKCGQELADCRTYVSGGCHEIALQNTEVCSRADTWINPVKILMDVMGKSKAKTFDEFYSETLSGIKEFLLKVIDLKNKYEKMWCVYSPMPLCSAVLDGCINNMRDLTEGGTKYATTSLSLLAPATLADSLFSIRKLVFEKEAIGLSEFHDICEKDFEKHEQLRQKILNELPKYGTGNRELDAFSAKLLKDISALFRDENGNLYKNARGGDYLPVFYPHDMYRLFGTKMSATPDGRKAGMSLSRGCSPSEHIALENPAGILHSVSQIDFTDFADSFCTEITLPWMDIEKGTKIIYSLIKIFIEAGGSSLQINLLNREALMEAQKNPDKYPNMCVRVCGYSAVFTTLPKFIQDEIIMRAIRD